MNTPKDGFGSEADPKISSDGAVENTLQSVIDILNSEKGIGESLNNQSKIIVPEELKEGVLSRMKQNYPGLEMLTSLNKNSTFTSYIFTEIKAMNDNKLYGPVFVDKVLINFKNKFLAHVGSKYQAVWDDYKNFVITPSIEGMREEIILDLMKRALDEELSNFGIKNDTIPKLGVIGESGVINGNLSDRENIITSIAGVRMEAEKTHSGVSSGYLDFYDPEKPKEYLKDLLNIPDETIEIGDSSTTETHKVADGKYYVNVEEDISQRSIFDKEGNVNKRLYDDFLAGKIPQSLNLHKVLSETIFCKDINKLASESAIREKDGKIFTVIPGGEEENIAGFLKITDKNGFSQQVQIFNPDDGFFNTSIITMVRKDKIPASMALYKKVRKILDMLVADGEFIFPHWENKGGLSEKEYIFLKEKLENGEEIDLNLLKKGYNGYYKGGLSKEGFSDEIKNKTGQLFFIDIKDMGSINMRDFYLTLEKVRNGEITKEQAIIQSGGVMTDKFISIIEKLDSEFSDRDIQYTIGGDEIKLFIGGVHRKTDSSKINSIISEEGIFGRITTSRYNGASSNDSAEQCINKLDDLTVYSKDIEELFAIIERRLLIDERTIGSELSKIDSDKNIWNTDIFSRRQVSDTMRQAAFHIQVKMLTKMKSELKSLYDFHIELDPDGNHENDTIHFAGKGGSYAISDIFDLESKTLVPNSPFIDILRKKGLSREDRE